MIDKNIAHREPTSAEEQYIFQQIGYQRNQKIIKAVLLIIFCLIISFMGFMLVKQGAYAGFLLLITGLVLVYFLVARIKQVRAAQWVMGSIVPIMGAYRSELRGSGRTGLRVIHYIGEYTALIPSHWLGYLKEGEMASGEAHFFAYRKDDGSLEYEEPAAFVVSLKDRYSIERERAAGLMSLKVVWQLVPFLMFGLGFLIFGGVLLAVSGGKCVDEVMAHIKFRVYHEKRYSSVSEFLSSWQGEECSITIDKGVVVEYENNYYLTDFHDRDENVFRELNKIPERILAGRELLVHKLEDAYLSLYRKEAWYEFTPLADNPEYSKMKQRFLTEGYQLMKEEIDKMRQSTEQGKPVNKIMYTLITSYRRQSKDIMEPFLAIENKKYSARERAYHDQERKKRLKRIEDLYRDLYQARPGVLLAGKEWNTFNAYGLSDLQTEKNCSGLVAPVMKKNENSIAVLNTGASELDEGVAVFGAISLVCMLFAFAAGIPSVKHVRNNNRIMKRIKRLYGEI